VLKLRGRGGCLLQKKLQKQEEEMGQGGRGSITRS